MSRRNIFQILSATVFIVTLLGGCAPSATQAPTTGVATQVLTTGATTQPPVATAGPQNTLVVAVGNTPASLDIDVTASAEGEMVMANTSGGDLFGYKYILNPQSNVYEADLQAFGDQGVVGLLADSWDVSSDGKTITVHLKHGVKSQYGNEFTADDYIWSWQRMYAVNGTGWFIGSLITLTSDKSIQKIDQYTVQFTLQGPSPIFFKALAQNYYGGPFDSVEAKKHATAADPWAKDWMKTHSDTYGPYMVGLFEPGVELDLLANPYWSGTPLHYQKVILKVVPDSSARLALLQAGQVDIAWNLNELELQSVASNPKLEVTRSAGNNELYIGLVVGKPPLDNVTVRQALAYATPYQDILDKVFYGKARTMTSVVPDIYYGHIDAYTYQTDLAKAKALLAQAGYPNGIDITLSYNSAAPEAEQMAILVKSSWEQAGIRTTLNALPTAVYSDAKYAKPSKLQAFVENQQNPWTGDPGYSCAIYLKGGLTNYTNAVNYANPTYDSILTQAMQMPDGPARLALTNQAQQIVANDVPWVEVGWFNWSVASKQGLSGFAWAPDNEIRFSTLTSNP
ncbi:ABC transporter substrate-binding protein [bacterium]|nr:MAG: ABC transporter substrate-binding protein [bacterium]